jgi:nucleoside-diphosphate-sugar epimerase
MEILIIGGTRNAGHFLALELLQNGHNVTVFNRGKTRDELPGNVRRLHGDRSDKASLANALDGKSFDAVVDMALYNEADAGAITELLHGRVGQYIFISTGQVYLVRKGALRPFREEDSALPLIPAPASNTRDYEEWLYGVEKSQAEEVLQAAWETTGFPLTTLRLPMVNSERDHFSRIRGYLLRLQDGGPILLPTGDHLSLRHVDVADVVQAIMNVIKTGSGKGYAYNISQDETITIEEFIGSMARMAGYTPRLTHIPRDILETHGLLPECSPFSDSWMSELDNTRSKLHLGMRYTPVLTYLERLVSYYTSHQLPSPVEYQRRAEELSLAARL